MNKEQFLKNREALGLEKAQLAKKLDVSLRQIDHIEKGDRKPSRVLIRCFEYYIFIDSLPLPFCDYVPSKGKADLIIVK